MQMWSDWVVVNAVEEMVAVRRSAKRFRRDLPFRLCFVCPCVFLIMGDRENLLDSTLRGEWFRFGHRFQSRSCWNPNFKSPSRQNCLSYCTCHDISLYSSSSPITHTPVTPTVAPRLYLLRYIRNWLQLYGSRSPPTFNR